MSTLELLQTDCLYFPLIHEVVPVGLIFHCFVEIIIGQLWTQQYNIVCNPNIGLMVQFMVF